MPNQDTQQPLSSERHFISASCEGEICGPCWREWEGKVPATHKLGEEIAHDDPSPCRHNLTQYVCCACYARTVGPAAPCAKIGIPSFKLKPNGGCEHARAFLAEAFRLAHGGHVTPDSVHCHVCSAIWDVVR